MEPASVGDIIFKGPIFFNANSKLCLTYELDANKLRLLPWNPKSSAGQVWLLYQSDCETSTTCTVRTIIGSTAEYVMVVRNGKTITMEKEFTDEDVHVGGSKPEDCFQFGPLSAADETYQLVSVVQDGGVIKSAIGVDKVEKGQTIKLKNPANTESTTLVLRNEDFVYKFKN